MKEGVQIAQQIRRRAVWTALESSTLRVFQVFHFFYDGARNNFDGVFEAIRHAVQAGSLTHPGSKGTLRIGKQAAVCDCLNLRGRWSRAGLGLFLTACLIVGGCASNKNAAATRALQASEDSPPPGPDAKINISYSQPGDYLNSLTVTEYAAAAPILTESVKGPSASVIRFDGGIVIWQIGIRKKLLADVPMVGDRNRQRLAEVIYGKLPANFVATVPDSGPPPPLQSDHYYVFTASRASSVTSYEAVKVNGDGSLEAYAAEPRAGDSFRLCCNVAADFVVSANAMPVPDNP
jgi:hypothetical protein